MTEQPANDVTLQGRVCLVTGANSGVGKATAMSLAGMGATVLMVCRDRERGQAARDEIIHTTDNGAVQLLIADLASQQDIRRLAAEIREQYPALHVLVNNAGVYLARRLTTVDGIETTFAVNDLAPFLLTNLLLDLLKSSAPARIVNVSSEAHRSAKLDFDDLRDPRRYWGFRVYGRSKLALMLFTYELARRLQGTGVTANAVHPGTVATSLGDTTSFWLRLVSRLGRRFLATPEQGADTVVYLASSPAIAGASGAYFIKRKSIRSSDASYDQTAQDRFWELCVQWTGLKG